MTLHIITSDYVLISTGAFVCNISSPSFNTVEVSCELLGNLARVNVSLNCTTCNGSEPFTLSDVSPIVIPNLPARNYTVDVFAVDINLGITEMIAVSDNITTGSLPTYGPTTDATTSANKTTTSEEPTDATITNETATDEITTNASFPITNITNTDDTTATNETATTALSPVTNITSIDDTTTTNETIASETITNGAVTNMSTTEDITGKYSIAVYSGTPLRRTPLGK